MSSSESSANPNHNLEIDQALSEVEQSLKELENRYQQIKQDWQKKSDLVAEKQSLEQIKSNNLQKDPIKTQIRQVQKELDRLELNLESMLLPDLFWQIVRFVGIGILVGWGLKELAT